MIQLKTVLTAVQVILCAFLMFFALKSKDKISILIGACLMIISIL